MPEVVEVASWGEWRETSISTQRDAMCIRLALAPCPAILPGCGNGEPVERLEQPRRSCPHGHNWPTLGSAALEALECLGGD